MTDKQTMGKIPKRKQGKRGLTDKQTVMQVKPDRQIHRLKGLSVPHAYIRSVIQQVPV